MAKGIIYCMTTIVPGLIKIGKTGSSNFDQRMYTLEHNGYSNVVGLKRNFAIEVEDYDEKEEIIHNIFSKSRVGDTELFAVDINLVVQLLSSMEGKQVYPIDKPKEVVFDEATDNRTIDCVPDGIYYFDHRPHNSGKEYKAKLKKKDGILYLCKGSQVNTERNDIVVKSWYDLRNSEIIKSGVVVKDIECDSLSMAGALVKGYQANGWEVWKTEDGQRLDIFRRKIENNK